MAFLDRIERVVSDNTKRSNHLMAAGIWMWQRGDITRAQFMLALELDGSDDAQIDEVVAHYQARNTGDKDRFFGDFTAWTIALEDGKVTQALFKNRFDMT
jgi:hypothetical protein